MADLGNGTFLNPIMSGDHPDPSILKDGDDYYMTFSSFESVPGIHIWHSRDLVNWQPVVAALTTNIGSVWAPELIKHEGKFYCYIPARFPEYRSNYVIWADRIEGPWSEPIDLKIPANIDPGHIVGEDGKRYLFLNGGDRVRLTDDGLATDGPVEQGVYKAWRYPEDWIVEGFAQEGPKLLRHGEYFYMITAIGGTAGPPTGHMVIAARSKSINGPWEDCPHNPIVRTASGAEKWWSRGHATLVEGPTDGDWWMVYHGYENAPTGAWAARPCWTLSSGPTTAGSAPRAATCPSPSRCRAAARPCRTAWPCRTTSRRTSSASSGASTTRSRTRRIGCVAKTASCTCAPRARRRSIARL